MSLSKELASFHEAGHAICAYYINRDSLGGMGSIVLERLPSGRWTGSTNVSLGSVPENLRIDIALAGLLAEGRRNGIQNASSGGYAHLVENQRDLPEILADAFNLERTEVNQQSLERIPIWARHRDGAERKSAAAISFADLDLIPVAGRSAVAIAAAVGRLTEFFNARGPWTHIDLLAGELYERNWPPQMPFDYVEICKAAGLPQ